ncbi:hypothetical protein IDH44_09210 [Paenibacillus sp. IB182496]|uniref:Uncharacterized protein n=1 Tax=Paenibacillus sabuli TaxID=2772509 RepID=A0A927BRE2_9BACL|nr:hypothetical protein [Paenibacillus sabuli]MBD2845368.1 hypothetical protein [Paenibacillus sabuli]
MNRFNALLRLDLRRLVHDPMLLLVVLGPLLLIAALRWGWPPLSDWLALRSGLELAAYTDLLAALTMLVVPQLAGIASGLLVLDERDAGLLAIYAVTPLRSSGYWGYRLLLPSAIALGMSGLFLVGSNLFAPDLRLGAVLVLLAAQAPIYAMALVALSANKVEGLALSKLVSLTVLAAPIAYWVPMPWQLLAAPLPGYWPAMLVLDHAPAGSTVIGSMATGSAATGSTTIGSMATGSAATARTALWLLCAVAIHGGHLWFWLRRCKRKLEL